MGNSTNFGRNYEDILVGWNKNEGMKVWSLSNGNGVVKKIREVDERSLEYSGEIAHLKGIDFGYIGLLHDYDCFFSIVNITEKTENDFIDSKISFDTSGVGGLTYSKKQNLIVGYDDENESLNPLPLSLVRFGSDSRLQHQKKSTNLTLVSDENSSISYLSQLELIDSKPNQIIVGSVFEGENQFAKEKEVFSLVDLEKGNEICRITNETGHREKRASFCYDENRQLLFVQSGDWDGGISAHDFRTKERVYEMEELENSYSSFCLTNDNLWCGREIIEGLLEPDEADEVDIYIYDLRMMKLNKKIPRVHEDGLKCLEYLKNNNICYSFSKDGYLKFYSLEKLEEIKDSKKFVGKGITSVCSLDENSGNFGTLKMMIQDRRDRIQFLRSCFEEEDDDLMIKLEKRTLRLSDKRSLFCPILLLL